MHRIVFSLAIFSSFGLLACAGDDDDAPPPFTRDGGGGATSADGATADAGTGDAATTDAATRDAATRDAATPDAATRDAAITDATTDASAKATHPPAEAGGNDAAADGPTDTGTVAADVASFPVGDGAVLRADRFVTAVVSFTPTSCTGFGQKDMPGIVEGPPVGKGSGEGSTDVVSLGCGGSIVVSFAPNAIIDGPGPDFIVFENPFWIGGNKSNPYAEPGEVSVSDDGTTWSTFPCAPTVDPQSGDGTGVAPPYPANCGGWQVVYSAPGNGISPVDPSTAGGLALDLADIGVTHARYVKIVDKTHEDCPEAGGPTTNGFDLDAIAIVNAELP